LVAFWAAAACLAHSRKRNRPPPYVPPASSMASLHIYDFCMAPISTLTKGEGTRDVTLLTGHVHPPPTTILPYHACRHHFCFINSCRGERTEMKRSTQRRIFVSGSKHPAERLKEIKQAHHACSCIFIDRKSCNRVKRRGTGTTGKS
jgi:hypothetical protein